MNWFPEFRLRLIISTPLLLQAGVIIGVLTLNRANAQSAETPQSVDRPRVEIECDVTEDVAQLIGALDDADPQVRGDAIAALGKIGTKAGPAAEALVELLSDLNKVKVGNTTTAVAEHAQTALISIGRPSVEALIVGLDHEFAETRSRAAEALGQIKDPRAIDRLIEALDDEDRQVAGHVTTALGRIGEPTIERLTRALQSASQQKRDYAAAALGKTKSPLAVDPLVTALEEGDDELRLWAAHAQGILRTNKEALKAFAKPETAARLVELLKTDERQIRNSIASTLYFVASDIRDLLVARLLDPDPRVRNGIAQAAWQLRDDRLISPLLKLAARPVDRKDTQIELDTRVRAIATLRNQIDDDGGNPEIEKFLIRSLREPNSRIRRAAAGGLIPVARRKPADRLCMKALMGAIGSETDAQALFQEVQTLGDFSSPESVDVLLDLSARSPLFLSIQESPNADDSTMQRWTTMVEEQIVRALAKTGDRRAIPAILTRLPKKEPFVIRALGELGHRDSVPVFIEALSSQSRDLRTAAAEALAANPDRRAIEALGKALENVVNVNVGRRDSYYCQTLAKGLSGTGERRAFQLIIEIARTPWFEFRNTRPSRDFDDRAHRHPLSSSLWNGAAIPVLLNELNETSTLTEFRRDSPATSRELAAWSLRQIFQDHTMAENVDREAVVSVLIKCLNDAEPPIQTHVARILGVLREKSAIPAMIELIERNSELEPEVTTEVANSLSWIGAPAAGSVLAALLTHENAAIRKAAIFGVTSSDYDEAGKLLVEKLSDESADVRATAARQLGFVQDASTVDPLLSFLKTATEAAERENAAQSLGMLGADNAVLTLITLASDESSSARPHAAIALAQLKHASGPVAMREILKAREWKPRERLMYRANLVAMYANDGRGAKLVLPEARQILFDSALHDVSPRVRGRAIESLQGFSDQTTVNKLIAASHDEVPHIRSGALNILARTTDVRRIEVLRSALSDESPRVRGVALFQLGKLADTESIPKIAALLNDDAIDVRLAAIDALVALKAVDQVDAVRKLIESDSSLSVQSRAKRGAERLSSIENK